MLGVHYNTRYAYVDRIALCIKIPLKVVELDLPAYETIQSRLWPVVGHFHKLLT